MPEPRPQQSVLAVLRHAPRPVWVLVLGVFVNRVGSYFSIFVVLFLTAEGFAPAELPPLLTAIGATSMVGSLAGGWLADRHGRKASLVGAMTASALSLGLLSVASGRGQVVVAVCLVALCTQSYVPAASALLLDHTAPGDRVPVFALFRLALNLGAALGPPAAGLLAASSYTALFVVDGGTCLLFALVLLVGLPATPRPAAAPDPPSPGRTPGPVLLLCLAVLGVAMVYAQHISTLPLRLTAHGLSAQFYGVLLAVNAVLVIALELPLSALSRRFHWRLPLGAGASLITLGIASSGLVTAQAAVLVTVAVWSLGEMLLAPVANAAIAGLSPPERIGRYQGLLSTAQAVGFSLGPAAGTFAYATDERLPWAGSAAVGLVAVLVILAVGARAARHAPRHARHRHRPRHARAPRSRLHDRDTASAAQREGAVAAGCTPVRSS